MPTMVRISEKAKKVAYKILGVPANIASKKTPKQIEIDRDLQMYETRLAK